VNLPNWVFSTLLVKRKIDGNLPKFKKSGRQQGHESEACQRNCNKFIHIFTEVVVEVVDLK
jgi:hypothetical protein